MNDKRRQLLEAAIDLFSKEGFWNTSTARISKHAGVATGTLFNYFPSKEDLIDEVYIQLKQEVLNAVKGQFDTHDVKAVFHHVWTRYTHWGVENPVRFSLLEQLRLSDMVSHKAQEQVMEAFKPVHAIIEMGLKDKIFADIPVDYLVLIIATNIETSIKFAVDNKLKGKKLDEFCEKSFAVLWDGLSA